MVQSFTICHSCSAPICLECYTTFRWMSSNCDEPEDLFESEWWAVSQEMLETFLSPEMFQDDDDLRCLEEF